MNQVQRSKTAAVKALAIIGLLATIAVSVWLLVQVARVIPNAFSSLASIAESIQSYRPVTELNVATEKTIVNSGEAFRISWTDLRESGTYDFTYACSEGVSLDVRTAEGDVVHVSCTDTLTLPENVHGLDLLIASEKGRFMDVPFTIRFKDQTGEILIENETKVTVVNATIPQVAGVANVPDNTIVDIRPQETKASDKEEVAPAKPGKETLGAQVAPKPALPTQKVVSYIPQSYENGFTDLKMSYLGVGRLVGNTFETRAVLDNDDRGALKFEVRNIGTKTSKNWTFKVTLPSGFVYQSDSQSPLKPNERAEFTLGYDTNDSIGVSTVKGIVNVDQDTVTTNNSFSWTVTVVE